VQDVLRVRAALPGTAASLADVPDLCRQLVQHQDTRVRFFSAPPKGGRSAARLAAARGLNPVQVLQTRDIKMIAKLKLQHSHPHRTAGQGAWLIA
jgi:hypothetical protein